MTGAEEREIKLSASPGLVLPDLADLAGGRVADSGVEPLESVYWDTDPLDLVQRGFGLRHRRRRDRPDQPGIWTLKTPGRMDRDRVVRGEHEVAGQGDALPPALAALLPEGVEPGALHPVAILHASRRVLTLAPPDGGGVEVMDDTVEVRDGDGAVVDRFREIEVEVGDGGDQLADRVAARLREAGVGPPESGSKYRRALRALGHQVAGIGPP